MIITHASAERITEVKAMNPYTPFLKGCLCFGAEGNEYNMAGECNYQYNLVVNNIINVKSFFYHHDLAEQAVQEVIELVRNDLEIEASDEEIADLLSGEASIRDFDFSGYEDAGEAEWAIQQFQGILAHKLGYDCAKSSDEQGVVYIAYCVDREIQEVEC